MSKLVWPLGPAGARSSAGAPDSWQLETKRNPPLSGGGLVLLIIGSGVALAGVGLLIGSVVVHAGVQAYNQGCSAMLHCVPESDPSGWIAAGGVAALIIGVVLVIAGLRLRSG